DQHTYLINALAQAHNHGVTVDWTTIHTGHTVPLPTYPFQRQTYWLHPNPHTDITSTGLTTSQHPLLTALIEPAGTADLILAGRISRATHPWLADHSVLGTTLLAGTAFLDMALHAAELAGCDLVDELTLETPLALPDTGAVQIQVSVNAPDDAGHRAIAVHSRTGDTASETVWVRHAAGSLASVAPVETASFAPWPGDVEPIDVSDVYDRLAEHGYRYGPAFQGLQAVSRHGEDLYVEVSVQDGTTSAADHLIHPALLDAVLHSLALRGREQLALPFAWRGVRLHTRGAAALRARISSGAPDSFTMELTDAEGTPVASVESLLTRPVTADLLAAVRNPVRDALFQLRWQPVAAPAVTGSPAVHDRIADFGPQPIGDVVDAAHASVAEALAQLRSRLTDDQAAPGRLVIVTHQAVAVGDGHGQGDGDGDGVNLAHAAVWGLVRSAQNEHPGRFVLVDVDEQGSALLETALATGEPQVAIRDGQVLIPQLVSVSDVPARPLGLAPDGTVLITGGTGALGALLARHLVTTYGVQHLLLTSRRGPDAPGAPELARELTNLGATITITAADIADPQQL
ncbi:polyketide synthase dehydratase domain-containing protein, partial [Nonomuraea sp. NPDC002799]